LKIQDPNPPAVAPRFLAFAKTLLADRPIICDIGSRDAQDGIFLIEQLDGKELHIFEPNPYAAQLCRQSIAQFTGRRQSQAIVFNQIAVGDSMGRSSFYRVDTELSQNKDIGFSSLFRINPNYTKRRGSIIQDEIVVDTTTLDEYFKDKAHPDLLWIDVEGAEMRVFRGAVNVLRSVTLVHVEVSFRPMQVGKPLFWEVHDHLQSSGFAFQGFSEVSAFRGFLCRHRLLPNPPWRLNAIYYKRK
jgi:FkbM family methyltransferase